MDSWIYRLYCTKSQDPSGDLLYVGITDSPSLRMSNHESQKWWWWLVDRVEWQRCFDRIEAEALESKAIAEEIPLFNKAQSTICAWERLRDIVYLLWSHDFNSWQHPLCPFCDSHGDEQILSPDGHCQIFRRNADDRLVLHFEVSCDRHIRRPLQWAIHIPVNRFLEGFGRVPRDECFSLGEAAVRSGKIPWERRLDRASTLAEAVDCGGVSVEDSQPQSLIEAK